MLAAAAYAAAAYLLAPLLLQRLLPGAIARLLTDFAETGRDGVLILLVFGVAVPAFAALAPKRLSRVDHTIVHGRVVYSRFSAGELQPPARAPTPRAAFRRR